MRVLLPLRKQAENKQSSNENLVDLGNAASERDSHEGNVATLPSEIVLGFLDQQPETGIDSFLNRSDFQLFGQNKSPSLPFAKRAWKTTGLTELDRTLSVYSPRKRPRTIVDDSGKRPAIEAKLPAKPSSKMGLGAPNHKQNIWCGNSSNGRPLVIWDHHAEDDQAPTLERSNVTNDTDDGMFELALKKRGLEIQEQEGDGNCLFRAVSLQVYGDPSMHSQVRKQCLDFMVRTRANPSTAQLGLFELTYLLHIFFRKETRNTSHNLYLTKTSKCISTESDRTAFTATILKSKRSANFSIGRLRCFLQRTARLR